MLILLLLILHGSWVVVSQVFLKFQVAAKFCEIPNPKELNPVFLELREHSSALLKFFPTAV